MLPGSVPMDQSGMYYGQQMQGNIAFSHMQPPGFHMQAPYAMMPGQPPTNQFQPPMAAGPMHAPNGVVKPEATPQGGNGSRDTAVEVQPAVTSPTGGLNKDTLRTMLEPGFTDKVSYEETLAQVRAITGEMDCYVTLSGVTVTGEVDMSSEEYPTVGSTVLGMLRSLVGGKKATSARVLLNDVTTAFEPGKLCLVLGPPSSGKSSLLKYTCGRLAPELTDASEGKLRYNGIEVERKLLPRVAAYVPQTDEHTP
eukprot:1275406-Rhodomonas_salina.2